MDYMVLVSLTPHKQFPKFRYLINRTNIVEYNSKLSLNESNEPMKALIVTKPIEQYGVDADEVLNNLKEMCRKDDTILHQRR